VNQWLDGPVQSRYWRPAGIIQWPSRRGAERIGTRPHGRRLAHDHAAAIEDHLFENCVNYSGQSLQAVLAPLIRCFAHVERLREGRGSADDQTSPPLSRSLLVLNVLAGSSRYFSSRNDRPQAMACGASAPHSTKGISGSKPSGSRAPHRINSNSASGLSIRAPKSSLSARI
jgi:hypothetical protein